MLRVLVVLLVAFLVRTQELLQDDEGRPVLNEHGHRVDAEGNAYDEHGRRVVYTDQPEEAGFLVALRKPPEPVPDSEEEQPDKCDPCGERARELAALRAELASVEARIASKRSSLESLERWLAEAGEAYARLVEHKQRAQQALEGFRTEVAQLVAEKEGILRGVALEQLRHQVARAKEALAKLRSTGSTVAGQSADAEHARTLLKSRIDDLQKRIDELEQADQEQQK